MPIRDYNFVTGAETGTLPTAGTPSASTDLTTKDYVDTAVAGLTTLADGKIYVGNASNVATEVTPSGDVTMSNAGVMAIASDVIVNADVKTDAAIARTKLASGTASHVLINDGSGVMSSEAALAIARGGTNNGSLAVTAGGTLYTDGTKIVNVGAGSSGQILRSNGSSAPSWAAAPSGGINYISANSDAESDASSWTTYDDGAATPVDLTGGSFGGSFARTTTTPLRGTGSLLYTPGTAGEGVAFTITPDLADYGNVLEFGFDYDFVSATGATGDYTVWVYDVANSVLIQPAGYQVPGATTGIYGKFKCTFQVPINATTLRIGIHQAASTSAAIEFDNVYCGPQVKSYGPAVTDWVAWTPTFSAGFGTVTSVSFWHRRIGDSVEIRGSGVTGTTAASAATITLPSGLTIDSNKIAVGSSIVGSSSTAVTATANYFNGALVFIASGATNTLSFSNVSDGAPKNLTAINGSSLWGNSTAFSITAKVPITGWSSGQLLSSDADTRVVAAVGDVSGTHTSTGNYQTVPTVSVVNDTHSAMGTAGTYTVPVPGYYQVNAVVNFAANATGVRGLNVSQTGSTTRTLQGGYTQGDGSAGTAATFAGIFYCSAGDVLTLKGYQNSGGNLAYTGSQYSFWSVSKLSGPSQIAASETVAARYSTNAGATMTNAAWTLVDFEDKSNDSHNAVTTGGSWKFTAPNSGRYRVSAQAWIASGGGWASTEEAAIEIRKNTTRIAYNSNFAHATTTSYFPIAVTDTIQMVAGDYIDCRVWNGSGGNLNLHTDGNNNFIAIERVGNY